VYTDKDGVNPKVKWMVDTPLGRAVIWKVQASALLVDVSVPTSAHQPANWNCDKKTMIV
jgi:hypothetical protein